MTRCLTVLLLVAAIGSTSGAAGQGSPDGTQRNTLDYAPVTLYVACGELFASPCAKVLPRIAARTVQAGFDLKPVESGDPLDTAAVVCAGQVAGAIVQRDAIALIGRRAACLGRYDTVGRSLYPLYALLVVKADAPFRQLDDLVRDGRQATIAAGPDGSGGEVMLEFMRRLDAESHRNITSDDDEAALKRLSDGTIDAFLTTTPLDGTMIDRIRLQTDVRGKPLYAFIDVRPGPEFFRIGDGSGHCLYRLTALDFGGPSPVTTVSVDAVMMLGRGYRDAHARSGPRAPEALAAAIDAAQAAILADMKSPADWRPAGTSCQ